MSGDRLSKFHSLPGEARIGLSEVGELLGRHRQTLWRYVKAGALPKPKRILGGRPTWSISEIRKALEASK